MPPFIPVKENQSSDTEDRLTMHTVFKFNNLSLTIQLQIARDAIAEEGSDCFTVRIKNNDILVTDGPSLAPTSKLHMHNIFHWFSRNPQTTTMVEIDISSNYTCDYLDNVAAFIRGHPFLLESLRNPSAKNPTIVGWLEPSYHALVYLAYAYGNFAESHNPSANLDLSFGQVADGFAYNFAVAHVFEKIL